MKRHLDKILQQAEARHLLEERGCKGGRCRCAPLRDSITSLSETTVSTSKPVVDATQQPERADAAHVLSRTKERIPGEGKSLLALISEQRGARSTGMHSGPQPHAGCRTHGPSGVTANAKPRHGLHVICFVVLSASETLARRAPPNGKAAPKSHAVSIELIIWSFLTVKVIDYRFRFLQSIRST
jgi:hypothetical protein